MDLISSWFSLPGDDHVANESLQYRPPIKHAGLVLIVIPMVTILGNLLVIISVLRYRTLQTAINFLILGLAVADLLVALFVMPYAVYVHVQRGEWYIGNLMCDIYMASDVACSTASILLLAIISFDRYRAVSHPIQYSRQSRNIRRVLAMIAASWMVSLLVASPMVFGVNVRPPDANSHECRFYNAEFSIGSSIISFVIPCILVLFVYIRILITLKRREKAAKLRRMKKFQIGASSRTQTTSTYDCEEVAQIATEPVVNVMMMALPTMAEHMRKFEEHRAVLDAADENECTAFRTPLSSVDTLSDYDNDVTNGITSIRYRDSRKRQSSDTIIPTILQQISRQGPGIFLKSIPERQRRKRTIMLTNSLLDSRDDSSKKSEEEQSNHTECVPVSACKFYSNKFCRINKNCDVADSMSKRLLEPQGKCAATMERLTNIEKSSKLQLANHPEYKKTETLLKGSDDSMPTTACVNLKLLSEVSSEIPPKDFQANSNQHSLKEIKIGIVNKMARKTLKHEQSFKQKVSKSHRKEKRATKTLGVVVGVFLICWVPFFFINIVNAICILLNKEFCQVGFDLFFYSTWIGYMNSFMNPIIYTIFNSEFRRAFKAILFGKSACCFHKRMQL